METSAIVAIILRESDSDDLIRKLTVSKVRVTSVVNLVEAGLGLTKNFRDADLAESSINELVSNLRIEVLPVLPDIFPEVMLAVRRYGKGLGGKLNFGDLFSYALAKRLNVPILFTGNDFPTTDLRIA